MMAPAMGYSLGVDVGTTFTAAAVSRDGHVEVVSLGTHQLTAPTIVFAARDEVSFGSAAMLRGQAHPAGVAREFKRRVGDAVPLVLSGAPYSADRLVALYARWVVETVSEQFGEQPQSLVMTHPANWTEFQLHLLRQSFDEVGLAAAVFLTEPEAGAIDYAAAAGVQPGEMYVVYDLGGGTFDVALLRKEQEGFTQVGEAAGLERLGGIDFDEAVFQHVVAQLPAGVVDSARADPEAGRAMAQLRRACIEAKEGLSSEVAVDVPVVLAQLSTTVRLTRLEFEEMIRPPLRQTVDLVRRMLDAAGVAPAELSGILLVGGSSRIPLVSQVVQEGLGVPTRVDAHPKLVVARGAARWAATAMPSGRAVAPGPRRDRRAVIGAVAALAVLGGGAALAATQLGGGGSDADPATTVARAPATTAVATTTPPASTAAPTTQTPTTQPATTQPATTVPATTVPVPPDLALAAPVDVPEFPDAMAFDGDEFWLTATGAGQLARLDAATGEVLETIDVGPDPLDVAFGQAEGLWVTLRAQELVVRIDPTSGEVLDRVEFQGRRPGGVLIAGGAVWVTIPNAVARIDPETLAVQEVAVPEPGGFFFADDLLWVAQRRDEQVMQIDPVSLTLTDAAYPVGEDPDPVVVADGVLWVGNRGNEDRPGDTVSRIDLATGDVITTTVGTGPADILVDGNRVWVITADAGTLVLLDAPTGDVLLTEQIGGRPLSILEHDGHLWITLANANQVLRVDVT
jgi:actin-like ATPase involved in cell morphogenesis/streptogramin lyase